MKISDSATKHGALKRGLICLLAVIILATGGISANAAEKTGFQPYIPQKQWFFNSPADVAVDSSGNVYVADMQNHRILKMDKNGTFIAEWGSQGSGEGEFLFPSSIALDGNDNVFVVDRFNHRIQKFDTNGAYLLQWGEQGAGNGQFETPKGVATDSSGYVYITDSANSRIQKFDGNGIYLAQWGSQGSGQSQFSAPYELAIDSKDNVYVSDQENHRIQKFDKNGTFLMQWGSRGLGNGQFLFPEGIAIDGDDNVYVHDSGNYRVQKFSGDGTYETQWGHLGRGDGQFFSGGGIDTDLEGNVLVADTSNRRIQFFQNDGTYLGQWGSAGSGNGMFRTPIGVAFDNESNLYVADGDNQRVQIFSAGDYVTQFGENGTNNGQFLGPGSIGVDDQGYIYVLDIYLSRLQKFDKDGTYITQWGGSGDSDGLFDMPRSVAVDTNGYVYVADTLNNRIEKFDQEGNFVAQWGIYGNSDGKLIGPYSIAVDGNNHHLYVADTGNHRIQIFDEDGSFIGKWGSEGSGDGQLKLPSGLALDVAGNVYVSDAGNNRIQMFTGSGRYIAQWGGSGNEPGQFSIPYGLAISGAGDVFAVDASNNRIQVLRAAELPIASLNSGSVVGNGSVISFDTATSGAAIYYTTDGTTPTLDSASGNQATITGNPGDIVTVKAIAFKPGAAVSRVMTVNYTIGSDSVITPVTASFDKYGSSADYKDVATELTPNGNTLVSIANGGVNLVPNADYAIIGNTVTISKAYLAGQPTGSVKLTFNFNVGAVQTLDITVRDSTPSLPDAPRLLSAVAGNSRVTLEWSPVDGAESYKIYQSVTGNAYGSEISSVTGSVYGYVATGLANGTTYSFSVRSTNRDGDSESSNVLSATPMGSPGTSPETSPGTSTGAIPTPVTPEPASTGAKVLINGKEVDVGIVSTTETNHRLVTTVVLDEKKLKAWLESAASEGALITIVTTVDADEAAVEFSGELAGILIREKAIIEIKTARSAYKLPVQQLAMDTISDGLGKNMKPKEIKLRIEVATPTDERARFVKEAIAKHRLGLIAPPVDFTVRRVHGDSTVEMTKFNAYVKRTIQIEEAPDPNKVTTAVVVESDGTLRQVPTKVITLDGKQYAQINSLSNSTYAVVQNGLEFEDMARHWAQTPVNQMGSRMIIGGTGDGRFEPDREITRAEFTSIIVRGLGLKPENRTVPFTDVNSSNWYGAAIQTAYGYDLIGGYADRTFRPLDKITREQAMTIIAKAMRITELKAKLPTLKADELTASFADRDEVSTWAISGVADTLQAGLVTGKSGIGLAPKAYITRAEVAVIVQRLLEKSGLI